jgi:hypothetical protein
MTAAPKLKRSDPLTTLLYDLENLHEDLQLFLPVGWVNNFDATVKRFIKIIHQVKAGLKERP